MANGQGATDAVLPARAGVILDLPKFMEMPGSSSRVSGGDPANDVIKPSLVQLFPRERG